MSLRTTVLSVLNTIKPVLGPAVLDLRPFQVTIQVRTWASGQIGAPNPDGHSADWTASNLVLPQVYEVKQMSTAEISGSGGEYEEGTLIVAGIIPADPANPGLLNAFFPTQLAPVIVDGQELVYVVVGPHNGEYALQELRTFNTFAYDIVLTRRLTDPSVALPDVVAGETE